MFIGRDSEDTHLLITTQSESYNIGKTDKSESFDDFLKICILSLQKFGSTAVCNDTTPRVLKSPSIICIYLAYLEMNS